MSLQEHQKIYVPNAFTLKVVFHSVKISVRPENSAWFVESEHVQSWNLKNCAEKDEREKVGDFQLSLHSQEKNYQPIKLK